MKIKVSDTVLVTTGKYKGKTGKVIRVYLKRNSLTVEKINIRTRHIRKTVNRPGEKICYEAPLHSSNVMLVCPHCHKATRVGYRQEGDAKKYRVCKKCEKSIDIKVASKKSSKK